MPPKVTWHHHSAARSPPPKSAGPAKPATEEKRAAQWTRPRPVATPLLAGDGQRDRPLHTDPRNRRSPRAAVAQLPTEFRPRLARPQQARLEIDHAGALAPEGHIDANAAATRTRRRSGH